MTMRRQVLCVWRWLACGLLGLAGIGAAWGADADTLSKIRRTEKFVIGTRDASAPLAYTLGEGRYVGYHVDLCKAIAKAIKTELRLPQLAIHYLAVTSQNRLSLLRNGTVDIECGSTTNNVGRQTQVAFAPTTYVTQVRILSRVAAKLRTLSDLAGKTVVTTSGTTSVLLLRKFQRASGIQFNHVFGRDHFDSFLLLETGRADAFVMDDQTLRYLMADSKMPENYVLSYETLAQEPIAIMVRKDDPAFKKIVDTTVRELMQSGAINALYDKWFMNPIPPSGINLNLPMPPSLEAAIEQPNDRPAESYQ
jgi:glutamate/aspartate transport system substrate-binding protein